MFLNKDTRGYYRLYEEDGKGKQKYIKYIGKDPTLALAEIGGMLC